jgi:hypothetical protein
LYHDDVGGNGDYFSGVYTGPDGRVQTGTSTATASVVRASSMGTRSASSTAQGSGTTAAGQATSAGAASTSVRSTAAAASSAAGFHFGANIGLMGLVAGLIV